MSQDVTLPAHMAPPKSASRRQHPVISQLARIARLLLHLVDSDATRATERRRLGRPDMYYAMSIATVVLGMTLSAALLWQTSRARRLRLLPQVATVRSRYR